MSFLVCGETITDAWLNAVIYLRSVEREKFDLVVDVDNPTPTAANRGTIATLDCLLEREELQSVRTVANAIFPAQLARISGTLDQLVERYWKVLPKIHRQPGNSRGTYFERLISYSLRDEGGAPVNQIDLLIYDLRTELGHRDRAQGAKRHLFEAQIFAPGRDRRPTGFPCMSSLSFHIDQDRLRLTATYRNQYYIRSALGNFLGLAELQQFMAHQVGLRQGPLTVHACHAEIESGVRLNEVDALVRQCRGPVTPEVVKAHST